MTPVPATRDPEGRRHHRTVDRVTDLLEVVAVHPGISFGDLARALGAPKSSLHGLLSGLRAKGWIHEDEARYTLGPVIFGLTLASGRFRAGHVLQSDLDALQTDTGMTVLLGVESGDSVIYVGGAGSGELTGYAATSNIRRTLISTAGGKALLAARTNAGRDAYLRGREATDGAAVSQFIAEFAQIRASRISRMYREDGPRIALASVVCNREGDGIAAAIVVGLAADVEPREDEVRRTLLGHVDAWSRKAYSRHDPV